MFIFKLALSLGKTVEELLDTISHEELLKWGEFFGREQFSEWRADFRAAQAACILANANRDTKKHPKAFEITEFMFAERINTTKTAEKKTEAVIKPETIQWLFAMARKEPK